GFFCFNKIKIKILYRNEKICENPQNPRHPRSNCIARSKNEFFCFNKIKIKILYRNEKICENLQNPRHPRSNCIARSKNDSICVKVGRTESASSVGFESYLNNAHSF
ncbi:MAG: hypothetical protein RL329_123, partial [Bacteroidota bacterium]